MCTKKLLFSKSSLSFFFLLATILYFVAAYFSVGFYHADEHYQIIEYANMRLGKSTASDLPWEYVDKIRPTIQIFIAMGAINVLKAIEITNPYTQLFSLRLITCFFALGAITFFVRQTQHYFKSHKIKLTYFILSYFLWFLPFLNVRFSSEIWSGLFLLLTISFYLSEYKKKAFIIGILAGLGFLFRFQIIFSLIGFFIWGLLIAKEERKYLLKVCLSFFIIIGLGILIDSFFYGEFVFTQFNYVYENIINNKSQNYGVSPWYYYLEKIITFPTLVVGIPLIISLIIFCSLKPKHIIVWTVLPFLLVHSIVGHKEERFLFPLIYYIPFILTFFYERFFYKIKSKILKISLLAIFILSNIFLTVLVSTKGTGRGRLVIAKYLHDNFSDKEIDLILVKDAYLFEDPEGVLNLNFYLQKNLNILYVNNICEMAEVINKSSNEILFVIEYGDLKDDSCLNLENSIFLKESLPIKKQWLSNFEENVAQINKLDKMLLLFKLPKTNNIN
jgi:phosphatidylinositol glycan class B